MSAPPPDARRDNHFFAAAQRWLHRNQVTSVVLVCHHEQSLPLGTKRLPAVEAPGCLSELPLYRLVDVALAGVRHVIVVPHACCDVDELADVIERWDAAVADLLSVQQGSAIPARNWAWSLSPTRVPVDRRGLLGLRQAQPPWPTHDVEADDHSRLITSLRAAEVTFSGRQSPALALAASGCTACGVCVQTCPHDALSLVADGNLMSLQHAPDACEGERQCVMLCPVDALTFNGPLPWTDVLEGSPRLLETVETRICERCRTRFPADSGSRWCEACRIRRSDPFGSHLPDAAIKLLRSRGRDSAT